MILRIIIVAVLFTFSGQLLAEDGIIVRTAALRDKSSYLANTITTLKPGSEVQLLERKGGWQKVAVQQNASSKTIVKADPKQGWIRGYQVRTNIVKQSDGSVSISKKEGGVLTGLSSLSKSTSEFFGRNKKPSHSNSVVATIGVRGLSEQDLANAKPDLSQLKRMRQYASSKKQAKKFAKEEKLKSHTVSELKDPDKKKKGKRKRRKKG